MFPKLNASSVHRATAPNTSMPAAWAATIAPNRQAVNKAAAKPTRSTLFRRADLPASTRRSGRSCSLCL